MSFQRVVSIYCCVYLVCACVEIVQRLTHHLAVCTYMSVSAIHSRIGVQYVYFSQNKKSR
jgi:hypothetical protein